jgi:hypothetical protein
MEGWTERPIAKFIFIWAFIGQTVPLILMCLGDFVPTIVHKFGGNDLVAMNGAVDFVYVQLTLWPSSIFLMLLDGPDRSRDGEVLAISILLNALLYSVIGFILWCVIPLFAKKKSGPER